MKQIGKYKGLLDMINGGGADAEGDKFEGGGLLSAIANAIATPYGSEDRMRNAMQEQRPMARPTGGSGNGSIASTDPASPQLSPLEMFGGQQPAEYSPQLSPLEMFGGQQPAEYSPQLSPLEMFGGQQPAEYSPQLSPLEMFGGQQPATYSPTVQGSGMTPANNYVPSSMPFDPPAGKVSFFEFLTNLVGAGFEDQFANNPQSQSLYEQYIKQR